MMWSIKCHQSSDVSFVFIHTSCPSHLIFRRSRRRRRIRHRLLRRSLTTLLNTPPSIMPPTTPRSPPLPVPCFLLSIHPIALLLPLLLSLRCLLRPPRARTWRVGHPLLPPPPIQPSGSINRRAGRRECFCIVCISRLILVFVWFSDPPRRTKVCVATGVVPTPRH